MRAAVAIVLLALLAGCVDVPEEPGPIASPTGRIEMLACDQTHTFASFPVEAFDGMLPEGWTVQPADSMGRTTTFYLAGSRCDSGRVHGERTADLGEAKEVFGYLFVVPPNGTDDRFVGELWPLGGVVSHGDALARYAEWGLADVVVQGKTEVRFENVPGQLLTSRTWMDNGEETFEVNAAVPIRPAEFHEGVFRVWVPAEGGVAGALTYAWPGGEEIGVGAGEMRYEGALLNAPPTYGVVVHHVRAVDATVERLLG